MVAGGREPRNGTHQKSFARTSRSYAHRRPQRPHPPPSRPVETDTCDSRAGETNADRLFLGQALPSFAAKPWPRWPRARIVDSPRVGAGEAFQQKASSTMTTSTDVVILQADLRRPDHQAAVVAITAAYALDRMANGAPLPPDVLERLIPGLQAHPTTLVFLAAVGGQFVGLATCFVGFSTFAARPVVNLHDLCVLDSHRGQGIGRALLQAVEQAAVERACAKVTLEVLEHNRPARSLYESLGFTPAVYRPENGLALFYAKSLSGD